MKGKAFEKRINRDFDRAIRDLAALREDAVTGLSRKFEHLANDTKEMATDAVKTLNKDVGHGLSQYNTKVQYVADRVPGGFGEKAARYPWVAISISLAVGFLLGSYLKPPGANLLMTTWKKLAKSSIN